MKIMISIIIKLRMGYFLKPEWLSEITLSKFDNYGYSHFRKDIMVLLNCTKPEKKQNQKLKDRNVFLNSLC